MVKKDGSIFTDQEIEDIKDGLSSMVEELKDDAFLSIYGLVAILILFVFKTLNIPFIKWFIDSAIITKSFAINFTIIFISMLIFWSIIDSVKVVFKITQAFELTKDKHGH